MLELQNALTDIGILDCNTKILYENKGRNTYLLSGNLPWNCSNAVLKIVDVKSANEIMFYKEPLLSGYRPEVYFVDKYNRFVVMEYVRICDRWNDKTLEQAIQFMAEMHSVYWNKATTLPEWIPVIASVSEEQWRDFCRIVDNYLPDELRSYANLLKDGAKKVKTLFDSVLQSPLTLIHNDFMYVNMGFGKSGLVLFDWSELMLAPAAYEICYPIFQFEEVFCCQVNKEMLIDCYLSNLQRHGIVIDKVKFKNDCIISYLHKCLFSYIQHYLLNNTRKPLERKVPVVCDMIKKLIRGVERDDD